MPRKMWNSTPSLYPLDANSNPSPKPNDHNMFPAIAKCAAIENTKICGVQKVHKQITVEIVLLKEETFI